MKNILSHQCENVGCINSAIKDRYGNYRAYCSDDCKQQGRRLKFKKTYAEKDLDSILAKRKQTVQDKYGVDNISKSEQVRARLSETTSATSDIRVAKTRKTNLERYGVESTNSLPEVQAKKRATLLERYGVDHQMKITSAQVSVSRKNSENAPARLEKAKIANLERYGSGNPSSNSGVKEKRTATMIERFGVANANQNAEIHEKKLKSNYLAKDYTLPSGKVVRVQGYENLALDELLKVYSEDEISIGRSNVPRLPYLMNNSTHYYFPDFYIPKENLIIEVKSAWTYLNNRTMTHLKRDAVLDHGYNHKFLIYDNGIWYNTIDELK